jgi:hypothetical protein
MKPDPIARELGWLDPIFARPNGGLFSDKTLLSIQDELRRRWAAKNRLDLLNDLASRYGEGKVLSVVDGIIESDCRIGWHKTAQESGNELQTFIAMLWEPLRGAGFEYTMERSGKITQFGVTRCPLALLAREIGAETWLYHLACLTDEPSIQGFNPGIAFHRTQTLMQGHPVCDHRYTIKD